MWPFKEKKYFTKKDVDRIAKEAAQAATNESIREVNKFKNNIMLAIDYSFEMGNSGKYPKKPDCKHSRELSYKWKGYIKSAFDSSLRARICRFDDEVNDKRARAKEDLEAMFSESISSPEFIKDIIFQINKYQLNGRLRDDESEKR